MTSSHSEKPKPVWKTGFEVELVAPRGKSRADLAGLIASEFGGSMKRVFSHQSEPSAVKGMSHFEDLTLGFEASDGEGNLIAKCVDDLTLRADLDGNAASRPGWYRIISDDSRLIRLMMRQCDAESAQKDVLKPMAELFGTAVIREDVDIYQIKDELGSSVALAPSLPGERERACELVTAPLGANRRERLQKLLLIAEVSDFLIPKEAAVHVHFDATRLRKTKVFVRLVQVLEVYGNALKHLVGSNPDCVRLGALPMELFAITREPGFSAMGWKLACKRLRQVELTKYCDYNVQNVIHDIPGKPTFEVRVLPGSMDADEICRWAEFFEAILWFCVETAKESAIPHGGLAGLIAQLDLEEVDRTHWLEKALKGL